MNDPKRTGRVTIPTNLDVVPETIETVSYTHLDHPRRPHRGTGTVVPEPLAAAVRPDVRRGVRPEDVYKRQGDPHGVVVPQKAAYLAHDHGHPVGGKTHVQVRVKVVYGLDEPDAPHLKQVVHAFAPAHEFLHHAQHQPQVALYHPLAGLLVCLLYTSLAAVKMREKEEAVLIQLGLPRTVSYTADQI